MDERNVWQTLSAINVNEHTNKKGKFTYLSWNWAWATVMEAYPDSTYAFRDSTRHEDGSLEVWCEVTIKGVTREMWLAVTDHRNQPIKKPSCDHVANARMRCLVKAIAMHGLGFYIYAGEGLPMEVYKPPFTDDELSNLVMAINETAFEDDYVAFRETTADLPPAIKRMVYKKLSSETHQFIKENK